LSEPSARLAMRERLDGRRASFVRLSLRTILLRHSAYQPVLIDGKQVAGKRSSDPRLQVVLDACRRLDAASVLDLGCAEGYIVRRCAEMGLLAIGVDADAVRLMIAQQSLLLDGVEGFGLIKSDITPDTVSTLPRSDVTVCLSLMHHVMYEHGVDYACRLLSAIGSVTRTALVFEMGQSNEAAFPWSGRLPDMGSDPHRWISDFLTSVGFTNVEKMAEVESFNSQVRRATFVARPVGGQV
jgi:SAM-dependent methyltransferase